MNIDEIKFLTTAQKTMMKDKRFTSMADHTLDQMRELLTKGEVRLSHPTLIQLYCNAMGIALRVEGSTAKVMNPIKIAGNIEMDRQKSRDARQVLENTLRKEQAIRQAVDADVEAIQIDIIYVKDYVKVFNAIGKMENHVALPGRTSMTNENRERSALALFTEIFDKLLKRNKIQISKDRNHKLSVIDKVNNKVHENWLFEILKKKKNDF